MEGFNHICDTEDCGKEAIVFSLNGSQKIKSCEGHISKLLARKLQIIDIGGYNFISSLQDAAVYEERKRTVEKGRKNLAALAASCEQELRPALQTIERMKQNALEAVKSRFNEMTIVVTEVCREAKTQLSMLQRELDQYLFSSERELSPAAGWVCADLTVTPRFVRFGIADPCEGVSAAVSESWTVASPDVLSALKCLDLTQKEASIESAVAEAAKQAQAGILEALEYANSLYGTEQAFEEGKEKILLGLLTFEKGRNERNMKWLQRFWDSRQRYAFSDQKTTIEVGKQLASLLYRQLGRFSEAEQILRYCYSIAEQESPLSPCSMSLCNEISGLYFACEKYDETERFCKWVLETFGSANLPAEHYWTTLLYLIYSLYLQEKDSEAIAVFETWQQFGFREEGQFAEVWKLLTYYVAELPYKRAGHDVASLNYYAFFPTFPFTALGIYFLARISEESTREDYFRQAHSLFEIAARDKHSGSKYERLVNYRTNPEQDVMKEYQLELSIFQSAAPRSIFAAKLVIFLGDLLHCVELKSNEVIGYLQQALSVIESFEPGYACIDLADIEKLGALLEESGQLSEAARCYFYGIPHCKVAGLDGSPALSLVLFGQSLARKRLWREAEACFQRALSILEEASSGSIDTANILIQLGNVLAQSNRLSEAENCFQRAVAINEAVDPESIATAESYRHIGELFEAMRRPVHAAESFQKALSIYQKTKFPWSQQEVEKKISYVLTVGIR